MKKQTKNNRRLFWGVGCFLLIAIVLAVACIVFLGQSNSDPTVTQPEGPEDTQPLKLYWNLERSLYYGNRNAIRHADEDGLVGMSFAVDGQQVRLQAANHTVANKADAHEVMGLVFDERGVIVDVLDVHDCAGGYAAYHYYVESVDGNTVVCNNSAGFDGYCVTLELSEDVPVYRGGTVNLLVGLPTEINFNDDIIAVQDKDGKVIAVYVTPCEQNGLLYWNMTQQYDSLTGRTKRVPNELGYYEFELAAGGELLTVQTRDIEIASKMDSVGGRRFGLSFDEDGYVDGFIPHDSVMGAGTVANWYNITELDGNRFTAKKILTAAVDYGSTATASFAPNCKFYDVSSGAEKVGGEVDGVRIGDRVVCSYNSRKLVAIVFILNRKVESSLYWNVSRQYDSTNKVTTRVPNAQGEYEILLAVDGRQVTYKCKDKDVVTAMDARSDKHFGLKIEDGYITECYAPTLVTGGYTSSANFRVQEVLEDGTILATLPTGTKAYDLWTFSNRAIGADTKIYDVSPDAEFVGQQITEVKPGDKIHLQIDYKNELAYVYILEHLPDSPMYWNVSRKYDSKTKQTTRVPNAQGYYEILVAVNGRQKTVRTWDKNLVNTIDARADKHFGLELSGDIILKVYTPQQVTGGAAIASWYDVTSLYGGVTALRTIDPGKGKVASAAIASDCQVYNVCDSVNLVGERTTLRVGDRIHGEMNSKGELVVIYVVGNRLVEDAKICWNVERMWDANASDTTRVPNEQGWYEILLACDGKQITAKTKDAAIVRSIDSVAAKNFALRIKNGEILRYYSPNAVTGGGSFASWYDVINITKGGQVTAKRTIGGTNQGKETTAQMAKNCVVYNVSTNNIGFVGEKTTLQVSDRIHGLTNADGELVVIFVVGRFTLPKTEHTCDYVTTDTQWYEWNGKTDIVKPGHYVLQNDLTLSKGFSVSAAGEVILCLNGHTVQIGEKGKLFTVNDGATLMICDHKLDDGTYKATVTSAFSADAAGVARVNKGGHLIIRGGNYVHTAVCQSAGLIGVNSGGELTVYDGTFTGNKTNGGGAVICGYDAASVTIHGGTFNGGECFRGGIVNVGVGSQLSITGGEFNGGISNTVGGILYTMGTVNISGGTFTGGSAKTNGGQLYVGGNATITGGTFTGGYAANRAGGIYFDTGTTGVLTNCIIENGNCPSEGGNLGMVRAVVTLGEGTVIRGGTAQNGGNILTYGTLTIDGATIENGTANGRGGNIYNFTSAANLLTVSDGLIIGGSATAGGNIWSGSNDNKAEPANFTTLIITGGNIENGTAKNYGGNIAVVASSKADISGDVIIRGGNATSNGGNIAAVCAKTDTWSDTQLTIRGGTISDGTTGGSGGSLYSYYTSLEISDGTFSGSTANEGGNLYISTGEHKTATISGGVIEKGHANKGGNVINFGTTFFTGGVIRGGSASNSGPNIQVFRGTTGVFTISSDARVENGGIWCGGVAAEANYGTLVLEGGTIDGNVHISTKGKAVITGGTVTGKITNTKLGVLELGGDPTLDQVYLQKDAKLSIVSQLTGQQIPLSMETPGYFADAKFENDETAFKSADASYQVVNLDGQLVLRSPHTHCLCGGDGTDAHATCTDTSFKKWEATDSLPTESGAYYLNGNVTLTDTVEIPAGESVVLCLNGFTVTAPEDKVLWKLSGDLTLADCQHTEEGEDKGTVSVSANLDGAMVTLMATKSADAEFTMYGGNAILSGTGSKKGNLINMNTENASHKSIFNLYGGKLTATGQYGGAVFMTTGQIHLYGGTFENCKATEQGGAIYAKGGTVEITGNTLLTGCSAKSGGAVYTNNTPVTLTGGTVENCKATSGNGGGVAVSNSTLKVGGDFTVKNCSCTGNGGAIYSYYNNLTFSDGLLSQCSANEGGNLYIATGADKTATISGGIIEKGSANKGGNVVNFGTTSFTGGVIRNGTATTAGGNIQIFRGNTGVFTMSGDARVENGAVYCAGVASENKYGTLILQGGIIDAELMIDLKGKATITGGTVTGKITLCKNGVLELGGEPSIAQIYLRTGTTFSIVSQLACTPIAVSMQTAGQFATAINPGDESFFVPFATGFAVTRTGDALLLEEVSS